MLIRPAPTVWGEKLPFNTVCGEFASPAGGWVHAVSFSPSGDILAFASECTLALKMNFPFEQGHQAMIVLSISPILGNLRSGVSG